MTLWRAPVFSAPPGRTASSSRVRYLSVFWPVTSTGDLGDGVMVFVSLYAYWHRIVAGFLSLYQWMILVCYMMFRPMIPYGVVLCPPTMPTSHLTLVREPGRA